MVAADAGEQPLAQRVEEGGDAAAVGDDGVAEFVPERAVAVAGRDAEVAADIDDDRADRTATHFGGDFLLGGEAGGLGGGGRLGVGRRDLAWGARLMRGGHAGGRWRQVPAACGALAEPGFQGRGAAQAGGNAGEDDRDIGGAEGSGEEGEAGGGGALLDGGGELFAVVDQPAEDAEDATDAGGHDGGGPGWIGGHG